MDVADRPAFDAMLAELFGALDKPLTEAKREGFWKGLGAMSLMDFARARDLLFQDLAKSEGGLSAPRPFTVGDFWAAKRRLRAPAPMHLRAPDPEDGRWDRWALEGNRYLLGVVMRLGERGRLPKLPPGGHPTEELLVLVRELTAAKGRWVDDMRDLDRGEGVPPDVQKAVWKDYLGFSGVVR